MDGVLDCTGGRATAAPLVRTLVAQGIASLDALALGLRTNEHGALLAADGAPQERLYTLGPLRRGELYETTAVPEIRAQAQALAARILEHYGRASADSRGPPRSAGRRRSRRPDAARV